MASKFKYAASSTTVISLAGNLANGANTYSGLTGITQTPLDNSADKYPHCRFVLAVPDTFAAAPAAGGTFDLYMTIEDVDSTSDETPVPGASDIVNLAHYVGRFTVDNQDVAYRNALIVEGVLAGVEKALFYVANNTGQAAIYASTPITLKAQPFTYEDA